MFSRLEGPMYAFCASRKYNSEDHITVEVAEKNRVAENSVMGRRCLCDTLKPIITLSKLFGVLPVSIYHPRGESGLPTGACQLLFRWKSMSGLINMLLIIALALFLPFSFAEVKTRMEKIFGGTDLYTFTLQTVGMIFETTCILVAGRVACFKFTQGWEELNEVYHAICDSAGDLKWIKMGSYLASVVILVQLAVFAAYHVLMASRSDGFYQTQLSLIVGTTIMSLILCVPYTLSTLFLFICLLIRSHFCKITDMLRTILKKPRAPYLYTKIDSLRQVHEQLCQAVTHFEVFFGVQILLTLCTGCFTVTVGAYACIVQGEGISSPNTEATMAWATQMYCAAIFMIVILVAGQLVATSAMSPAPILNGQPLAELTVESQMQAQAFLQKIAAFPTQMTALKITNVSTTFLASAATNITTYLLVLMQFKLSLEHKSGNCYVPNCTDVCLPQHVTIQ